MRYILVCGGVISGIGKGVISSSLGTLLKGCGLTVTSIKIDPYLNIDAGTFSPFEHGEVFVLDDGGEVDLDLGNYERFLDIQLSRDNNITTGKVYQEVINRERRGDYLGKTVQVVPHITDCIQDWVERVAHQPIDGKEPDVCIIELGGTIGDIESMPFVEAFRQFQFRVGKTNFLLVQVSLVVQPSSTGEQKTKPTQHAVRELRGLGLSPDFICARSKQPLQPGITKKISNFCHVPEAHVISVEDVSSIYHVPLHLEKQNVVNLIWDHFSLPLRPDTEGSVWLYQWRELTERLEGLRKTVKITLVGKYTGLSDAYISVIKALQHASFRCNHKLELEFVEAQNLERSMLDTDPAAFHDAWGKICGANGILVPGGFGTRGVEGKVEAVKWAREKRIPFLGVCLGLQVAVMEYARNVMGWEKANSTEFDPETPHPVVIDMPELSSTHMGGTMRLGKRRTVFTGDCITKKMYGGADFVEERHRHRYEVNPEKVEALEAAGLKFVGRDVEGERMEVAELPDHPYFVAVQYHPEFLTRPLRPSPPFHGFILAACGQLEAHLNPQKKTTTPPSGGSPQASVIADLMAATRVSPATVSSSASSQPEELTEV